MPLVHKTIISTYTSDMFSITLDYSVSPPFTVYETTTDNSRRKNNDGWSRSQVACHNSPLSEAAVSFRIRQQRLEALVRTRLPVDVGHSTPRVSRHALNRPSESRLATAVDHLRQHAADVRELLCGFYWPQHELVRDAAVDALHPEEINAQWWETMPWMRHFFNHVGTATKT